MTTTSPTTTTTISSTVAAITMIIMIHGEYLMSWIECGIKMATKQSGAAAYSYILHFYICISGLGIYPINPRALRSDIDTHRFIPVQAFCSWGPHCQEIVALQGISP